ncbi:hypothetical protein NDU88_004958, partial [Pleurodeles waltl]
GHCLRQKVGIRRELEAGILRIETALRRLKLELGTNPEAPRQLLETRKAHNDALERLRCHDYKA